MSKMQQPTFDALVHDLANTFKDLASDVHLAELLRAVRRSKGADISQHGELCRDRIDARAQRHCSGCSFVLSAPPLWLACYRGDIEIVTALLRHGADADATAENCDGGGIGQRCKHGGQSALHVAVSRGCGDSVRRLLALGATPHAPMCFPVDELDEPEWDESAGDFVGGLAGLSALQMAASRETKTAAAVCAALLEHGADGAALRPCEDGGGGSLAPLLQTINGEDGAPLECAICLQAVLKLTSAWTPCCCKAFHAHCLRGLHKCPLCRTPMRAAAEEPAVSDHGGGVAALDVLLHASPEDHRAAALALSFRSASFDNEAGGDGIGASVHDRAGGNYGWRVGGQHVWTV